MLCDIAAQGVFIELSCSLSESVHARSVLLDWYLERLNWICFNLNSEERANWK